MQWRPAGQAASRVGEEVRLPGVLHGRGVDDAPERPRTRADDLCTSPEFATEVMTVFVPILLLVFLSLLPILLLLVLPLVGVIVFAASAMQPEPQRVERRPYDE